MRALVLLREPETAELWSASIRKIYGSCVQIDRRDPDSVRTVQQIHDILDAQYSCVILPLTLPAYNSLRIAEYSHRLHHNTLLVLCSLTNADKHSLLTLFDGFVGTYEVSLDRIQQALSVQPTRLTDIHVLEGAISTVLATATIFTTMPTGASHRHLRTRSKPPDLADYRSAMLEWEWGDIGEATPVLNSLQVADAIRGWIPKQHFRTEEAYEAALAEYLEGKGFTAREQQGASLVDILVQHGIAIELKLNPNRAEYDRLVGQIERHLKDCHNVIVLIVRPDRRDLLDEYRSRCSRDDRVLIVVK